MIILNIGETGIAANLRIRCYDSSFALLSTLTGLTESAISGTYKYAGTVTASTAYVEGYNSALSKSYGVDEYSSPVTIPPSGNPDTIAAYITCRDASGTAIPSAEFNYQIIGVDPDFSDAWDDDVVTINADSNGLVTFDIAEKVYLKYWITGGRYRTVHITAATADPYQLPTITG
jgi:hypothetical protein